MPQRAACVFAPRHLALRPVIGHGDQDIRTFFCTRRHRIDVQMQLNAVAFASHPADRNRSLLFLHSILDCLQCLPLAAPHKLTLSVHD